MEEDKYENKFVDEDIYLSYFKSRFRDVSFLNGGDGVAFSIILILAGLIISIFTLPKTVYRPIIIIVSFYVLLILIIGIKNWNVKRKRLDEQKEREIIFEKLEPIILEHKKYYGNAEVLKKEYQVSRKRNDINRTISISLSNREKLKYNVFEFKGFEFFDGKKTNKCNLRIDINNSEGNIRKVITQQVENKFNNFYYQQMENNHKKMSEFTFNIKSVLKELREIFNENQIAFNNDDQLKVNNIFNKLNRLLSKE